MDLVLKIYTKSVMTNVVIIGAGGHSKVVADTLKCMGHTVIGHYDDNNPNALGLVSDIYFNPEMMYICAIGDNEVRKRIVCESGIPSEGWITAIHPSAVVSDKAIVGVGTLVCAGAVIQPNTSIGDHCIINTNASVDHDCVIQDYTHIAPGTTLCGKVTVGEQTFIGAGSTVINAMSVGSKVLLGAGSVVIRNIPNNTKAYGVPATCR